MRYKMNNKQKASNNKLWWTMIKLQSKESIQKNNNKIYCITQKMIKIHKMMIQMMMRIYLQFQDQCRLCVIIQRQKDKKDKELDYCNFLIEGQEKIKSQTKRLK